MVKISMLQITARTDYPTEGRSDLHLWEPTLQTLARQTFKDFELIIIDVFYDERPDYFEKHNYGLKIKHVPAAPNPWHKWGLVQTCSQFNKGIVHADGELIFTDADSSMLPPDLMANLWKHYQDGYFVSLGFGADLTFAAELYERKLTARGTYQFKPGEWQGAQLEEAKKRSIVSTDWYSFLGYKGLGIMDHRYRQVFSDKSTTMFKIKPDWFYGISTFSMEAALKVNGFDVSFDGDSALNDVDMGYRLVQAGYNQLAMFRDSYIVEAYAKLGWHPNMRSPRPEIKCNYAILQLNRLTRRTRVNTPLSSTDLEDIQNICSNMCPIRDKCKELPHRGPFFNKNEPELYEYWKKHGATFQMDLEIEREMRKNGEEYQEGTFITV